MGAGFVGVCAAVGATGGEGVCALAIKPTLKVIIAANANRTGIITLDKVVVTINVFALHKFEPAKKEKSIKKPAPRGELQTLNSPKPI